MCICHNKGLFSIVNYIDQHDKNKETGKVLLRARAKDHIPEVFPNYANNVEHTPFNDYAYRVLVDKNKLASDLSDAINNIDYPNFKASVKDHDLNVVYSNFWNDARWIVSDVGR